MKKLFLLTTACYLGSLLTSAGTRADSYFLYPYACPSAAAFEEANDALDNYDDDAFEDTNCQSIPPETEYRILRCDENISEKYLEKFA